MFYQINIILPNETVSLIHYLLGDLYGSGKTVQFHSL